MFRGFRGFLLTKKKGETKSGMNDGRVKKLYPPQFVAWDIKIELFSLGHKRDN